MNYVKDVWGVDVFNDRSISVFYSFQSIQIIVEIIDGFPMREITEAKSKAINIILIRKCESQELTIQTLSSVTVTSS